ncbi:hypothetical protein HF086_003165 [Spodoptera exigua]|uniref:BTB domain-containing protein n=1 Tax=Spodoptera exigua TaxID=7107 RepID=A0A922SF74_SPOEX|nr:hypothetical protein HF086_003165 [Spodoptera exigua]
MENDPNNTTAGRETGRCMSVAAMQALHRLRECRLLCDAIVRADDGAAFPVHRAILSACSPYFLALFTTTLHSREQSDVLISGVRSEILLLLIEYAYLRRIEVTDVNVHELLMTADYLAFLGVLQLCCDHLRASLNPKNCLGIMMFARRVFCYKLEADARRYLLRYFVTVATQSDEFLHLPLEELNSIILEDELNVKSEEVVWEAVLRWVNYDPDSRWQHTVKLMGSIRLGLLDTQFFLENVKDHPYVTGNEGSRPIIIETLKFLYDLEMIAQRDGEVATPEIARPRVPHEVLFAIGGWSGGSPTAFIETYDTRADRWIKVAPMNARRCYVSVAVLGETIYAMGGYDGHHRQNTAERFNHRTNQWSLVAPMNAQRSDASAAALDTLPPPPTSPALATGPTLYEVCAPEICESDTASERSCSRNVSVRNKRRHGDDDIKELKGLISSLTSKVDQSFLELKQKNTELKESLQFMSDKYDLILKTLQNLQEERADDKKTIQKLEEKIEFLERKNRSTSLEIRNIPICLQDDKKFESKEDASLIVKTLAKAVEIYVIGGFNGISRMCSGEVYDPASNTWSPVPDMYNPRSNFAIEVIDDMIFAIGGYEATDMNIYRSALSACVIMGLPNVYDYIHKHRERLMEEKRQKILLSETARHGQHRTALPDVSIDVISIICSLCNMKLVICLLG